MHCQTKKYSEALRSESGAWPLEKYPDLYLFSFYAFGKQINKETNK